MPDIAANDPLKNVPRYVQYRGRRARVIGYEDGMFLVLDHNDQRRKLRREQFIFLREKKKSDKA